MIPKHLLPLPAGLEVVTKSGFSLVTPNKSVFMSPTEWQGWEEFRSVIFDPEGNVVSRGFEKFFNYGESTQDTAILHNALDTMGEVIFTEKLDGSLIIRYVIGNKVLFRTRGTFDGGEFYEPVLKIVTEKYPVLLKPNYLPTESMLFEYVSPDNRIVLPYEESDLIFIGCISNQSGAMSTWQHLENIAAASNLNLVKIHTLPRDIDELIQAVTAYEDYEGVVARVSNYPNNDVYVKIKSAKYLALHRLYSYLTPKHLRELCDNMEVVSLDHFQEYIESNGGDWEVFTEVKPWVDKYIYNKERVEYFLFPFLVEEVKKAMVSYPDRKSFAVEYANGLFPVNKACAFKILDGKEDEALAYMTKKYLDAAFDE